MICRPVHCGGRTDIFLTMKVLIAYDAAATWSLPTDVTAQVCGSSPGEISTALTNDIEVLVTDAMPPAGLPAAGLRWIHLMSAGYNQAIGHRLAQRPGMRVSNAAGICAGHMAEFIIGQMLRHVKRWDDCARLQQERTWANRVAMATPALRGRRALIVGYGGVGRETARLLTALGVQVDAVQRRSEREPYRGYLPHPDMGDAMGEWPARLFATEQLPVALAEADFIILTIPLTPHTRHLLNARSLTAARPGAVIINVGRGGLIDPPALITGLDNGRLAHAYLDVFEPEPLPADSPFWTHPRITVTPHMSGVMPNAGDLQADLLRQNLRHYQAGEPLLNEIPVERLHSL
jgi:phosphoglycerate dehydrogenase-like enzyme